MRPARGHPWGPWGAIEDIDALVDIGILDESAKRVLLNEPRVYIYRTDEERRDLAGGEMSGPFKDAIDARRLAHADLDRRMRDHFDAEVAATPGLIPFDGLEWSLFLGRMRKLLWREILEDLPNTGEAFAARVCLPPELHHFITGTRADDSEMVRREIAQLKALIDAKRPGSAKA